MASPEEAKRSARVILIRHGESEGNAGRVLQGHSPFPLTPVGRAQAEEIGVRLRREGITAMVASPLPRAWETAMIAGRELALTPQACPGLVEYDFGEATAATYAEVRAQYRPDWPGEPGVQLARLFISLILEPRPAIPGEEGFDAFARRVRATMEALLDRGGTVAAVTHGGVIGAVLSRAAAEPRRVPGGALVENAAGLVLVRRAGGAWLTRPW